MQLRHLLITTALVSTACTGMEESGPLTDEEVYAVYETVGQQWTETYQIAYRLIDQCLSELGVEDRYLLSRPSYPHHETIEESMEWYLRPTVEEATANGYTEIWGLDDFSLAQVAIDSEDNEVRQVIYHIAEDAAAFWQSYDDPNVLLQGYMTQDDIHTLVEKSGINIPDARAFAARYPRGCEQAVENELFADTAEKAQWEDLSDTNHNAIDEHAESWIAAEEDWKQCMSGKGITVHNGFLGVRRTFHWDVLEEGKWDGYDEDQKATAIADAECAAEHDVNQRLMESVYETMRSIVEEKGSRMFAAAEFFTTINDRAKRLYESGMEFSI